MLTFFQLFNNLENEIQLFTFRFPNKVSVLQMGKPYLLRNETNKHNFIPEDLINLCFTIQRYLNLIPQWMTYWVFKVKSIGFESGVGINSRI